MGARDLTVREATVSRPRLWVRFARDRRGAVALAVAVLLPILIGFAGIGVEVGLWFAIQRQNQSVRFGTPLSDSLRVLAAEMRAERLARYEERAARLPVLLALPLMGFILPSMMIVVGTPLILRMVDFLQHAVVGGSGAGGKLIGVP